MLFYVLSSTAVRVILRILFTIFFFWIGLLGSQCYKISTRLRLLNHERITAAQATGWLQPGNILDPILQLRRLPPNLKWWFLMAVVAILSKLTDIATAAVSTELMKLSCDFGYGMVLSPSSKDIFSLPPWNGRPFLVAGNAQIYSVNNTCEAGIYWKVNTDPRFCSTPEDLMGGWTCSAVGEDISYTYGDWTIAQIANDLMSKDLLYGPNYSSARTGNSDPYDFTHLVIWSSSEADNSQQVFNITASIDTTADPSTEGISMHSMSCIMEAPGMFLERIHAAAHLQLPNDDLF